MAGGNNGRNVSASHAVLVFVSLVASVFVGERLMQLSREVTYLQNQLKSSLAEKHRIERALQAAGIHSFQDLDELVHKKCEPTVKKEKENRADLLFIDVQPAHLENLPAFANGVQKIDDDTDVQTVASDEDDTRMPPILGQLDLIEDGVVMGWACQKGSPEISHRVQLYVNDVLVGSVTGDGRAAHPLVDRICAGPANIGSDGKQTRNVAFKFKLPQLEEGIYTLRAFVYSQDSRWRKELNSSPQKFVESKSTPGLSDAVKRKDAIIRARNAQVSSLYEQLHSRGIWTKVTNFERVRTFDETKKNNRYLAFVGLISNPNDIHSRELQRHAWFPKKNDLDQVAKETGIIIRFVIGKTDWMTEKEMKEIREEMAKYDDILIVDMRGFEDPAKKTLAFFSAVAFDYDVDFVFKAERDTVVDIAALAEYLKERKDKGNLYMGCMKSGEVVKSARQKWHEPEHWKFGDGQGTDRKANYPRHAHRQFLGVSQLIARYLAQNIDVMHFYANDDVSVGVWLLGLDVEYVHEPRLCCLPRNCANTGSTVKDRCIGIFDAACAGVCKPDITIGKVSKTCLNPEQ